MEFLFILILAIAIDSNSEDEQISSNVAKKHLHEPIATSKQTYIKSENGNYYLKRLDDNNCRSIKVADLSKTDEQSQLKALDIKVDC